MYLATVFKYNYINVDSKIIRKFRENLRIFERELNIQNNSGCCCGVTLAQCHSLMELSKKDNITLNELSKILCLDKSTVSRTVESLVKAKLVCRTIPEENRRTTNISLTEQGKEVCRQINEGNNEYYKTIFNFLEKEELTIFLKSFETIVGRMHKLNNESDKCET